ncbi:lysophospholipid acyltransferase family protein [Parathalassolituus penaei]|uniref:Lysophospholipid acyltransferase family protein n=1 Tax=Parathalassolituus penaei TaxID=2997323 RepID=A0A9X3EAT3_9GAMM|nr:lysophospholipid acyltransferase family protein [Parathalassolituus penaei]MCY0964107.1 lysophospholipid acyltransferase family protein [Parathalassolituus penaei]
MELFDRQGLLEATKLSPRKLEMLLFLLKAPELTRIFNQLPAHSRQGLDLIEATLNYLNIRIEFDEKALRAAIPVEGPFITVSNHPFGFLDGVTLLLAIGRIRPDFRVVANFLLSYFAPISDLFITVNPFESRGPKGMGGMRKSLAQLNAGYGLGLFPAGEVSTRYKGQSTITDKEWSISSMRLIRKASVPVVPVYFDGHNSRSFHLLGKLHPSLRTLRIPAEFLKKRNSVIRLGVGPAITPAEMDAYKSDEELRYFLREQTYSHQQKLRKS